MDKILLLVFSFSMAQGQPLAKTNSLFTKPSFELYTSIEINASAEKVWDILLDFEKYREWNPFLRNIEGRAEIGEVITEEINLIGDIPTKMKATVNLYEKDHQFGWEGNVLSKAIGGGTHSFTIERLNSQQVHFIQKEIFYGIAIPIIKDFLNKNVRSKFNSMNEALKKRAEAP